MSHETDRQTADRQTDSGQRCCFLCARDCNFLSLRSCFSTSRDPGESRSIA